MATGSFITPIGSSSGGTTIIPYAAYLDTVSGNNATAVLGDSSKPYLTMTALIAALPATVDFPWTIYITGATLDILMPIMPPRDLTFNADARYVYNFNFNTGTATYCISIASKYFTYAFLTGNINLKSDAVSTRALGTAYQTNSFLQLSGIINIVDWSNDGLSGSTLIMNNSSVTINEFIKRTSGSGMFIGNPLFTRIKKLTAIGFYSGFIRSFNTYLSKVLVDLVYCAATADMELMQANSTNLEVELKEIQITGILGVNNTLAKLTLNDLICSATVVSLNVGEAKIVTGRVVSDVPLKEITRLSPKLLQNLEAKITGNINYWGYTVTIDNSRLTITDYIVRPWIANLKLVIFKGNNIIKQTSQATPLIYSQAVYPYSIDIEGTLNISNGSTLTDQFGTITYVTNAVPSYNGLATAIQSGNILT
jgi:hypothetical protein